MVGVIEKIDLTFKMFFDSRLRKDIKAFKYAVDGYNSYGWELCKEVEIVDMLKKGSTIEEIMKVKKIKNKEFLECLLDFLVGCKTLKYENDKYYFVKDPGPFLGKKYKFLEKFYPKSVLWTNILHKKAKKTLLTGKKPFYTGFDNKRFLKLWDGLMRESPWSFRKIAIQKFCKKIKDGAKILDLGCGSGVSIEQILFECNKPIYITGIDNSKTSLEEADRLMKKLYKEIKNPITKENIKHVKLLKYDLSKNFPKNEKYDVVFMSLLVHHIPKEKRYSFFRNVKKLLKNEGLVVVYQIIHKSKFERAPMWVMHVIPSHQEYPFKNEYLKMFYEIFSDVKYYLDGNIVIAKK